MCVSGRDEELDPSGMFLPSGQYVGLSRPNVPSLGVHEPHLRTLSIFDL